MSLPPEIRDRLRPWQVKPVEHLLRVLQYNSTGIDISDTGVGKTYVAAAVAAALKLPTLVIVPKVAISQWQRAAEHFGDSLSVINYEMLRTGRTPFGRWSNPPPSGYASEEYFQCESCQCKVNFDDFHPCYTNPQGIHCIETKRKAWRYGDFHFAKQVQFVIFDEAHRCGGLDSLNSDMMIAARREVPKGLALTATPATDPTKMRALGYFLDLHTLDYDIVNTLRPKFYSWASRYGVRREPMRGLQWRVAADKQLEVMAKIRETIIPSRGVRVRVEDIPGFPEREITSELYDLEEIDKINGLYADMAEALQRLDQRAGMDADSSHPLTRILRARQRIELLKIPIAIELARDYVACGHQVGIFANFSETLNELGTRLATKCYIRGAQRESERQRHIDDFQAGIERIILINSEAGGAALSLPGQGRVGLVFPPEKAITFKQLVGRFHRDGGGQCFYRVMLAAKTVETRIHRNLRRCLNNLDALTDGDLNPCNL